MKKRHIVIFLLALGVAILCLSVILAVISTASRNVIGGADFSTFLFVFYYDKRGLYSALAFLGIADTIISVIVGISKKKK